MLKAGSVLVGGDVIAPAAEALYAAAWVRDLADLLKVTLILSSSMISLSAFKLIFKKSPNETALMNRVSSRNVWVTAPTNGPTFPLLPPGAAGAVVFEMEVKHQRR